MNYDLGVAGVIVSILVLCALFYAYRGLVEPDRKQWVPRNLYVAQGDELAEALRINARLNRDFKWERAARVSDALRHQEKLAQLRGQFPKPIPRLIDECEVVNIFNHKPQAN